MTEPTHVVTTNGSTRMFLFDDVRPYRDQIGRVLGLLDGDKRWAYSLWRAPKGLNIDEIDRDQYPQAYLQSAGTAQAMTIEVRYIEADGIARQYVVGRAPGDYAIEPSVRIPYNNGSRHLDLYPNEVFTSEEATEIYYQYFLTDRVPDQYLLRLINQWE